MTGGIAQAYYGKIPDYITNKVREILNPEMLEVIDLFNDKCCL